MTGGAQALDWRRRMWTLFAVAGAYTLLTLVAQGVGDTPAWRESAPVEISTDLVASLGLIYAAIRALRGWAHPQVRRSWLFGCAGMFLIWCVEAAIGKFTDIDFRIIIAGWAIAPFLLFRSMQAYATRPQLPRIMWFGLSAQVLAHLAWVLEETVLPQPVDVDSLLGVATDTGELVALLSYIVAFVMARHSGMDELITAGDTRLQNWAAGARSLHSGVARPRVCFPFIAQVHQVFHSLPIAVALADRHPEIDVHVAGTHDRLGQLRRLVESKAGPTSLHFDELYLAWPLRLVKRLKMATLKIFTLRGNRHYLAGFDAVVVPERTSTYLRDLCPGIRLIGTEHGAGDREIAFSPKLALYDFLLLPGEKQARRLLELGITRPGRYASGIYAKLDWASAGAGQQKLFANDRVTVLYNPHFDGSLSSWPLMGRQVLEFFAKSSRYNLVFAPHIRLFDPPRASSYRPFREYLGLPHMLIDLGSERCADMTYTRAADIYIGDVSSQVVEFIVRPRPCIFLNPARVQWQDDLHYRFWHLGIVIDSIDGLDAALAASLPLSPGAEAAQKEYLRDSLGMMETGQAATRGAEAIAGFLRSQALDQEQAQRP